MKLGLGTAQFGSLYGIANRQGQVSQHQIKAIIAMARMRGVDTIDTAIVYGDSESRIGLSDTTSFRVITKLPPLPESCGSITAWVRSQLNESLRRLNRTSIYGLLLHKPLQLCGVGGAELIKVLTRLKQEGLVSKIGVSIYSPNELESIMSACDIDIVQAPFNLVDKRLLSSGWMERLYLRGVEIHTRSVFLQGLLLMKEDTLPSKFIHWNSLFCGFYDWLSMHKTTALVACLAFPLSFRQISRVIVGVDTIEQFSQLFEAEATALALIDLGLGFPDMSCNDEHLINPSYWSSGE
jgi:aryl-alcohol dehydrogenase-like predicted oxidoreductase